MFEKAVQELQERLQDNWTDTEIAFDNVQFNPVRGVPFIRIAITQTESELTSIAGPALGNYREHGLMTIQVFTPKNDGVQPNARLADMAAALYRGYSSGGLFCMPPRVNRVGAHEEFYQSNLLVEFYFDNCLTA